MDETWLGLGLGPDHRQGVDMPGGSIDIPDAVGLCHTLLHPYHTILLLHPYHTTPYIAPIPTLPTLSTVSQLTLSSHPTFP